MGLSSAAISMLLAPSASILSPILIESRTLRLESRTLRVMTQSRKGKPKLIRIYPYIVFALNLNLVAFLLCPPLLNVEVV